MERLVPCCLSRDRETPHDSGRLKTVAGALRFGVVDKGIVARPVASAHLLDRTTTPHVGPIRVGGEAEVKAQEIALGDRHGAHGHRKGGKRKSRQ